MSAIRTDVRNFDTCRSGHSVRVQTDTDLGLKFKRGVVLSGDSGPVEVAMVLGIDELHSDRIDISESSLPMREAFERIKAAVDLALEGCPA
jgi:hypothetical protein